MSSFVEFVVIGIRVQDGPTADSHSHALLKPWFTLWFYAESGWPQTPPLVQLTVEAPERSVWRELRQPLQYEDAMRILQQLFDAGILTRLGSTCSVPRSSPEATSVTDQVWLRFRQDAGLNSVLHAAGERLRLSDDPAHDLRPALRTLLAYLSQPGQVDPQVDAVCEFIENYPY